MYAALLLYYALSDENVPAKSKAIIYGALGYFILPFDFIPDAIPVGGFVDDYTALMLALGAVAMFIGEETKAKAKQKLFEWFEGGCESEEMDKVDSKI